MSNQGSQPSNVAKFLYSLAFKLENWRNQSKSFSVRSAVKLILEIAGLGCLTLAGFHVNSVTGLIVAGCCMFVLSWQLGTDEQPTNTSTSMEHMRR